VHLHQSCCDTDHEKRFVEMTCHACLSTIAIPE
jgi:hypothetical protein